MRRLLILALALGLVGCNQPATPATASPSPVPTAAPKPTSSPEQAAHSPSSPTQMRLVALGDSITAPSGGQFGNPCGRSWTTFLTLPLADFHNAGVAGNTTAQMLARLSPDVLAYHPTDVTILGGVNDLYQDYTYHDVPLQDSLANLGSTIGQIEAAGATAWLLTIPPWWAGHAAPVEAYNAALRDLAAAHGARLIDIWPLLAGPGGDWIPGYSCDDSHPTNAGAAIIAGAVQVRLSRGS